MKTLKFFSFVLCLALLTVKVNAQHMKLMEGDISSLRGESSVNVEFAYDNMRVGKYDKEDDYVNAKKTEYNRKESGKGDTWAKDWVGDRKYKYEPKFNELFEKYSEKTTGAKSKYTIIFHTTFIEPGYNIAISRKNAEINGEAWVVETSNKDHVIAKIRVEKSPGRAFWSGNDYDTGDRISEAYANAGKAVGKFIRK